jgi:hypothetical protein
MLVILGTGALKSSGDMGVLMDAIPPAHSEQFALSQWQGHPFSLAIFDKSFSPK